MLPPQQRPEKPDRAVTEFVRRKYREADDAQPPGAMLVDLAKSLHVTSDEILGLKPVKQKTSPKKARLLKRLQQIETLPAADQRAVLKFVEALVTARRRST
ncbi:MAG: hypothetical protein ACE5FA_13395 [Dehalococcoidia bacterium]